MTQTSTARATTATWCGLFIALFAYPLVLAGFQFADSVGATSVWLIREACVFTLLILLVGVVVGWERLPLSSMSPGTRSILGSILYGVLGLVPVAVGLAFCLWLLSALGWS